MKVKSRNEPKIKENKSPGHRSPKSRKIMVKIIKFKSIYSLRIVGRKLGPMSAMCRCLRIQIFLNSSSPRRGEDRYTVLCLCIINVGINNFAERIQSIEFFLTLNFLLFFDTLSFVFSRLDQSSLYILPLLCHFFCCFPTTINNHIGYSEWNNMTQTLSITREFFLKFR